MMVLSQGFNHQWLIGYGNWAYKGRFSFDTNSFAFQIESRKMGFEDTEANICDASGNFLMSSNGVWIANADNDTMLNGAGLNPGPYVNAWPDGLLITYGNILVPYPGDTTKYVLFHQTGSPNLTDVPSLELFYSVIDITHDSGLGEVVSKNNSIFQDTISWGVAACRHANGRDWWIIAQKDSSNLLYEVLFTSNGVASVSIQNLLYSPYAAGNASQITFSRDGTKFIQTNYDNPVSRNSSVVTANFDRCTGAFSNVQIIPVMTGAYLYGLSFSPSGQYIYTCSSGYIFQIDASTLVIDTVAIYDGFSSPFPPYYTTFFNMYLAANSKIYITSGSGVQHIHEMNYPDSAGTVCDVQQHAVSLGMWSLRAVPNHPNYYLGPVTGSVCDSLGLSVHEINQDFHFRIYPNPVSENFLNIGYLLPPNKSGTFQIYDITGKVVFKYMLPQWSNEQSFKLPELADGIYNCVITSGSERVSKKIAVIKE